MTCNYIYKRLIGSKDKILDNELEPEINKHIQNCPECKKLYEDIRLTYSAFNNDLKPEINPFFYTRLEQKLKAKTDSKTSFIPRVIWKIQPIAAIILIILSINMGIIIGKTFSSSEITSKRLDRTELLEAYASDYYLTNNSSEENINALITNE